MTTPLPPIPGFDEQYVSVCAEALDILADAIHGMNANKGFWDGGPAAHNVGEKIALMHSELSEALEAHRKGLKDDKLPEYDGLVVELADCVIRIFDFAGAHQLPLAEVLFKKLAFNAGRPHKHGAAY